MDPLQYILNKYQIRLQPDTEHRANCQQMPIELSINRADLAKLFNELGYTSGAEIGVEQGLYSEVLAKANPEAKIYLVDAWQAYRNYRDHVSQDKLDGFYETTKARVAQYRNVELVREWSVEAAREVAPESLDWCYLDANHNLENVIADIAAWAPKVRRGGICAGHDFFVTKKGATHHVPIAVRAYTEAYGITPYFVCRGDHSASWFWIRQ